MDQQRKLFSKKCEVCAETFWVPNHRLKSTTCSRKCAGVRLQKRVNLSCAQCGKNFDRTINRVSNKKGHFCSRACKDFGQSLRGNCPDIRPAHFGTAAIPDYRKLIPIKQCWECGCNEKYLLVVHHIDGNRENNNLDNLKVLCFNCHGRHHLYETNGEWYYSTKVLTPLERLPEILGDVV